MAIQDGLTYLARSGAPYNDLPAFGSNLANLVNIGDVVDLGEGYQSQYGVTKSPGLGMSHGAAYWL